MIKAVIVEDDRMVASINSQFAERTTGLQIIAAFHNGKDALAFLEKKKSICCSWTCICPIYPDWNSSRSCESKTKPWTLS